MSNDFLTSLSSRAIQKTGMDPASGGLSPRLASRFEPESISTGQGFDETVQADISGTLEARQTPDNKSTVDQGNRSEVQINQPLERRQLSERSLISPLQKVEGPTSVPERIENQTGPVHIEQSIPVHGQLETPHIPSLHMGLKPKQFQGMDKDDSSNSQPDFLHSTPVIAPQMERVQGIEMQRNGDPILVMHAYMSSNEPANNMNDRMVSITPPINQPKVVPERIEITHRESQRLISNIQQQLVPVIPQLERRSHTTNREPESQPPTINVTIGRIEVKATPPTTSTKRNARTAPTMSLDEYLRRRQGGGS